MSHKRVVIKGGKTYGPYLYESYRDKDGKVKKRYLGKHVEQNKNYLFIGFIVVSILLILLLFFTLPFTGRATISLDDVHSDGQILRGNMVFVLQQSELIPSSTQIIISHGGSDYSYSLQELIEEEEIQGNFFVDETTLNESGSGFGLPDAPRFPPVSFVLGIYEEINEAQESNETNESDSGQRGISGNIISTLFGFLTGRVSLELVEEVEGEVRANESFVYDLEDNQIAEIISSEQGISLSTENTQVVITTNYLGEESRDIEISLDDLNITAEEGELSVVFVYDEIELFGDTIQISFEEEPSERTRELPTEPVVPDEIIVEQPVNETNITEPLRETFAPADLTYVILNSTFGTNYTGENLTVYTDQDDNASLKLIRNWDRNGSSIMVLNMPFEGGSNSTWTKDYSGYGNNGTVTLNGTAQWNSTGGYDEKGAYEFDGSDDYIDVGDIDFHTPTYNFTLTAWFKTSDSDGNIVGGWTDFPTYIGYNLYVLNGNISMRAGSSILTGTSVNDSNWHFVIGTCINKSSTELTCNLYLDGVLDNSGTLSRPADSPNVTIGAHDSSGGMTNFFNGTIDEIQIYNYSLSEEQIAALYANRTDLIVSQETSIGDIWKACVTPNDGIDDGLENCSNTLTILEGPSCNCSTCDECELKLNKTSCIEVNLTVNISDTASCINNPTNFNNKTLDCKGYYINGDGSGEEEYGIQLNSKTNNTIRNCNIYNFTRGIRLEQSSNNTFYNIISYSNQEPGVQLELSSNYNNLTNITTYDNNGNGLDIADSQYNTLTNITTHSNSQAGIYILGSSSSHNVLINVTSYNNSDQGINIDVEAKSNTITDSTIYNNTNYGIYIYTRSSNNTFQNNVIANHSRAEIYFGDNSMNNTFINQRISSYPTNISFIYSNNAYSGNLNIRGVTIPPTDETEYRNISKYVNITNSSGPSWLYLNITFNDSDIPSSVANSTLKIWRYNGSAWAQDGWNTSRILNLTTGVVGVNITDFGSVFAPLAETLDCNCSSCDECELKLNKVSCTEVLLTSNISDMSSTCIIFPASNKILDCQGYAINTDGDNRGIYLSGKTNNTIKNCIIHTCGEGIKLEAFSNNNTLVNITGYGHSPVAIYLSQSSSNNLTNITIYDNNNYGILMESESKYNILNNITSYGNNENGIFLGSSSSNNIFTDIISHSNSDHGIYMEATSDSNTFTNITSYNNTNGIYVYDSNHNVLQDNIIYNNSGADIRLEENAKNNTFTNQLISSYPTNISFIYAPGDYPGGNLNIKGVTHPPTDEVGYRNISKYVNITNSSGPSWLYLNITFNDSDIPSGIANSTLKMWRYNGSAWTQDGWNGSRILNLTTGVVGVNITDFGSVFAPLAETLGCNCSSCDECELKLNKVSCTEVNLTANISDTTTCINNPTSFNHKTLDCQEYYISGDGDGNPEEHGIYLNSKTNNTIRNCNIYDFNHGIRLESSTNNTLFNITVYDNSERGIFLGLSSDYNNLTNITSYDNMEGMVLEDADHNTLTSITIYNTMGHGLQLSESSSYNNITDITSYGSSNNGVNLASSSNSNILIRVTTYNNTLYGISLENYANHNILQDNILYNNSAADIRLEEGPINNTFINQQISSYPTNISFIYSNHSYSGNLDIKGVNTPPTDEAGYRNISKYVNITNSSGITWLYLNITFNDSDIPSGIANSTLKMWRYDGGGSTWAQDGWNTTRILNLTTGVVGVNITDFGSVFAPLAETLGCNCSSCDECELKLNKVSCTEVNLTANISDTGTCINNPTSFSNKILDCRGYYIIGDGDGPGEYGISLGSKTNNTIRNCKIYNFTHGIQLDSSTNNTITNITIYNNSERGIFLGLSSDYNNLTNITSYDNMEGMVLEDADHNTLTSITIYNTMGHGLQLSESSSYNTLIDITSYGSSNNGVNLASSSNSNILIRVTTYNNTLYGISLENYANHNILQDNILYNNSAADIRLEEGPINNTFINQQISSYPTNISFIYSNHSYSGNLDIKGVNTPPTDEAGYRNISKYVNITNSSGITWLYLNITFNDSDIPSSVANSTLKIWRHNGSAWAQDGWNTTRVLNLTAGVVGVNITDFGSVFAPLAETLGCNCSSCDECELKLNKVSCTEVNLTANISDTGTCINNPTSFSNKILDCQGYYISGDRDPGDYGISTSSKTNNTIRNCNIYNFSHGIMLDSSTNNTITNITTYNNSERGINVGLSSNYNNLTDITSYDNFEGIGLDNANYNNLTNITIYNTGGHGLQISSSSYNIFTDIISHGSSNNGVNLADSSNSNTFTRITTYNNTLYGINVGNYANHNILQDNIIYNNSAAEIRFEEGPINNTFINQQISSYPTNISFIYSNHSYSGNLDIKGVNIPPTDEVGYRNISKYVNITNSSGITWLYLNITFNDSDIPSGIVNSTLKIWKYNGTWNEDDWNTTRILNLTAGVVGVNITDFGSIFAPLAETAGCNCSTCDECEFKLNKVSCTEVNLTSNITNYVGTCIDNQVNFINKTFDCQGHTISGDNSGKDYGISTNAQNNNSIKNCIIQNFYIGIIMGTNSDYNDIINSTTSSNTYCGVYLTTSNNNNIINSTANSNNYGGVYLTTSNNNNIINSTANSNTYGIYVYGSNHNILQDNIIYNNSAAEIHLEQSALNNTFTNQQISNYPTNISFIYAPDTYGEGYLDIRGVTTPPTDEVGYRNISKYVNITNPNGPSWLYLNITFNDSDIPSDIANSTLKMWRYNGSVWAQDGWNESRILNLTTGVVGVNITDFGSVFAPLAETLGCNCSTYAECEVKLNRTNCTEVNLTANISSTETCIIFPASNKILDCQGYYINGDGSGEDEYGVFIGSKTNNTIRNCNIYNFNYGIRLESSTNNTITNITTYNNSERGIYLGLSSDYNNLTNIITRYNNGEGIVLEDADHNNLTNITIYNNTGHGLQASSSFYNTLIDITSYGSNNDGINLVESSSNNILTRVTSYNNADYGIYLAGSTNHNLLQDNIIYNNSLAEIHLEQNAINNTFINQRISSYPTNISFIYSQDAYTGYLNIEGVTIPPTDPVNGINISKYINITNYSGPGPSWLFLNISYTDLDVSGLNESRLKIWKYSTNWQQYGWSSSRVLNESNNVVGVNITNFGSVFAPFDTTPDTIPPSNATVILNATSPRNDTSDNLTCWANATDDLADPLVVYYKWFNNSIEVANLAGSTTIPNGTRSLVSTVTSGNTTMDENWTCSILISDWENNASWVNSTNLTILYNYLPIIQTLILNSTNGTNITNENLLCYANATDANGGNITYQGFWYKNGENYINGFVEYNYFWNQTYDANGKNDYAYGVIADGNDFYVVAAFGPASGPNTKLGVVKYYSNRTKAWDVEVDKNASEDEGRDLVIASDGNPIAIGFSGPSGSYNVLIAKLNATDGSEIWYDLWSAGSSNEVGYGIDIDSNGDIYVAGYRLSGVVGAAGLLLKYNQSGSVVCNATIDGSGSDFFRDVVVDSNNNIYAVGQTTSWGASLTDVWLAKFDSSCNLLWNKTYGGTSHDYGYGIAVDSEGNIILGGTKSGYLYLIKTYPNGTLLWEETKRKYVGRTAYGYDVAVDPQDNIIITGVTTDQTQSPPWFWTLKYLSNSSFVWDKVFGRNSLSYDYAKGVDIDLNGNIIVTGYSYAGGVDYSDVWTVIYEPEPSFELANQTQGQLVIVDTLNSSETSPTDVWYCSVRAYDNINYSNYNNSNNLTVQEVNCSCSNCSNCEAKLNDPYCSYVNLTVDISHAGTCITFPTNNKIFDCQNHIIDGNPVVGDYGIDMTGKENNSIINCIIKEFDSGIFLVSSNYTNLTNNTISKNNDYGISIHSSSKNRLINNTIYNNTRDGLLFNNNANNNTISDNDIFNNIKSGILMSDSSNNTISSNIVRDNNEHGIYLQTVTGGSNHTITDNNITNNTITGIYLSDENNAIIQNNRIQNCSTGINLTARSKYNTIENNNISYYEVGISLKSNPPTYITRDNNITNNILYNRSSDAGWGFLSDDSSINNIVKNLTIGTAHPTKISFTYVDGIKIKSVETPPTDPPSYSSINKFINATNYAVGSSLLINFSYLDSDIPPITIESSLKIWKYNSSGWIEDDWNTTRVLDIVNNIVGVNIIDFGSVFAPLGEPNCTCINCSDCEAKLDNPLCSYITLISNITTTGTCINNPVNFSNKVFDCQNHTLTGDKSHNGIYSYNKQNITIKNCNMYNFSNGIWVTHSSDINITNMNIHNNSDSGMGLAFLSNSTVTDISTYNHHNSGISISSCSNNTFKEVTSYNNGQSGIFLDDSSDNNFIDIMAYNNLFGAWLQDSSDNNFTKVTSHNNTNYGIRIRSSSNNNLLQNNTFYNNSQSEIYIESDSIDNTFINQRISSYPTNISFIYEPSLSGYLNIKGVDSPTEDPVFYKNISKYIDITTSNGPNWLFLNISYEDSDIPVDINESDLKIWKHSVSYGWEEDGWNTTRVLDNVTNIVGVNITTIGSTFAPLGLGTINCSCSSCDDCEAKLDSQHCTVVNLVNNITGVRCIDNPEGFANKTFDCLNHSITGDRVNIGIVLGNKDNNTIKNCNLYNFSYGILLSSSNNNTIKDSTITESVNYGIYLLASSDNVIDNNNITYNDDGIYISALSLGPNNVTNNTINNNTDGGIYIENEDFTLIMDNLIYNNSYGVRLDNAPNNTIISNDIFRNTNGIYLDDSSENTIENNNITRNTNYGLILNLSHYNLIDANNISDNSDGIFLEGGYNNFTNNYVYNHRGSTYGFYNIVNPPALCLAIGEVCTDNSQCCSNCCTVFFDPLSESDPYNTQGFDKVCRPTDECGFPLSHNRYINNSIWNNTYGLYMANEDNNTLINNTIWDCDYGIYLNNTVDCNITGNEIYNHIEHGIYFYNSSRNDLLDNIIYNNTKGEILLKNNSLDNIFENQEIGIIYPTNISFIYSNNTYLGNISIKEVNTPPTDPSNYQNISKYVNITDINGTAWLFLNISYEDSDISGFNESKLKIWKYTGILNGGPWYEDGWNTTRVIDIINNIVGVNITKFDSVFAPLGGIHLPTQTQPILNSTYGINYTDENLTCYNQSTSDLDGDSVKNIFNWYKNETSIMVLNMPFEGGSNSSYTKDYSGFGNNGIVNGSTWNSTGGYDNKGAYEFDGVDDYIDLGSGSNKLTSTSNYTLSAWIKTSDSMGVIVGAFDDYPMPQGYMLSISSGNITLINNMGSVAGPSVNDNQWHHVVGVKIGAETRIYVDGEYKNNGSVLFLSPRNIVYIGAYWRSALKPIMAGLVNFLNGTIDDVQIYNHSLSAEQITALYNNRTDLIVSQETSGGEIWKACITPNDGYRDGVENCSNNLTILYCGNSLVENASGEQCDLTNLSGQTCVSQGFAGGTLSCTDSCTFDTSACTTGDGGGAPPCTPDCVGKECGDDGCGGSCGECDEGFVCVDYQCVAICTEDWNCTDWGACVNNTQNRTCADLNECGTEFDKPAESQSCEVVCIEDWECSWTQCAEGDEYSYAFDCVDLNDCGTEEEKPDQIACEELTPEELEEIAEAERERTGCDSIWICGDWGICEADYTLEEVLVEDITPMGVQRRECIDNTGCASSKTERRPCSIAVPIDAKTVEWCEETYVEIYESLTNKLVSRVKEEKIGFTELSRVDISFITTEFTGYCDYCYDGIKNYDEEDVDCGGPSCPECVEKVSFFDWLFWLLILLWGGLFIITTTRIWIDRKTILLHIRESRRQESPIYGKGVEETMKGQRSPRKIIIEPIKEKRPKIGFFDLIKRIVSREPYAGKIVTEKGISMTKPQIGEKAHSEKQVRSYREQKQIEKQAPKVKEVISKTKKQLRGKGI